MSPSLHYVGPYSEKDEFVFFKILTIQGIIFFNPVHTYLCTELSPS
jgi:hypothetical protein